MSKNHEEIEVVFLEIDRDVIEKRLGDMGAERIGDIFYRHISFDYPDYRLNADNAWIRLRDEGGQIVLAYKKRLGVTSQDGSTNDEGMEEVEVIVNDYEATRLFLSKIGLIEKHEAEKKRTRWRNGEVEFDIDTWPGIPTFLEIEATSWEGIDEAIEALGLRKDGRKICSANQIYHMYGIDVNDYRKLTFDGMVRKDGSA
ncbi:MAG TPA: class IV adenylate cyclase [Candidatus Fimivivens sp.]|nr:class IV adenylate cyclase [Candidatus Fimivivens sp.]